MKNYLVMKKRLLILYKNTHYIIPCKKNCFFLNVIFLSIETLHFMLEVEDLLFTQEIPNDIILLCMDYDVAIGLIANSPK